MRVIQQSSEAAAGEFPSLGGRLQGFAKTVNAIRSGATKGIDTSEALARVGKRLPKNLEELKTLGSPNTKRTL